MYWTTTTDARITTPTLSGVTIGTAKDFSLKLVTEAGEDLTDVYLFVADTDQAGLMQAKLSTEDESAYRDIMGPFDATCFLGTIDAETETEIDLRIFLPSGIDDGYRIIPILAGHDDGAEYPSMMWSDDWPDLWAEDWTDIVIWREDW